MDRNRDGASGSEWRLVPETPPEDFIFHVRDGRAEVLAYNGPGDTVRIPSRTGEGYPVTALAADAFQRGSVPERLILPAGMTDIADHAFDCCWWNLNAIDVDDENPVFSAVDGVLFSKDRRRLIRVPMERTGSYAVPPGVETIGRRAFYGSGITEVCLPGSVRIIENRAFEACSRLAAVSLPRSAAVIGAHAFSGTALTGVIVPEGVETISEGMFSSCRELARVSVPAGVRRIGRDAFHGCGRLESIAIPDGVEAIDDGAFMSCGLKRVRIPASVVTLGRGAFDECFDLTCIEVEDGNPAFSAVDGVLFSADGKTLIFCPRGRTGSYVIPSGVEHIGPCAFDFCRQLTDVTIPESVKTIGPGAFERCFALARPVLPAGMTNLDRYGAFDKSAAEFTVPRHITAIREGFFTDWPRLRRIDVADGNPAFVAVDGVLFSADRQTLLCCPQAREGEYAVPEGTTVIAPAAFAGTRLTRVTIPGSVRSIGKSTFFACKNLEAVTICRGVTAVGAGAFSSCYGLKEVCIPDTVTSVEANAFGFCGDLAVTVPRGSFPEEYCRREGLRYRFPGEDTVRPVWPEEAAGDGSDLRIRYLETFLKTFQARYSCGNYTSHLTLLACEQPGPDEIMRPEDDAVSLIGRVVEDMEFNAPEEEQRRLSDEVRAEILSALAFVGAEVFDLTEKGEKIHWSRDTFDACMIRAADRWYLLDLSYYD